MKLILVYISGAVWSGILVIGAYHLELYLGHDPIVTFGAWLWVLLFLSWRRTMLGDFK